MKKLKMIAATVAASVPFLLASGATAPAANASLASCTAHYANTVAWINCHGGTEASWARIGVRLAPFNFMRHGDWFLVPAGQYRSRSVEAIIGIRSAWVNVRPY
jgi:hypothetical protein